MDGGTTLARPHSFTVADYHRMAEAGILDEDSRCELIRGQIIDMSPIGAPHIGFVIRLNRLLLAALAGRGVLSIQNPLRLDDGSEPEPDVVVLKPRADDYESATPSGSDVLLVIEVAESSLKYDREVKVPLYAEAGIPEVWIVDVGARTVEAHRRPEKGRYTQVHRIGAGDLLDVAALAGVTLSATELLRPVS